MSYRSSQYVEYPQHHAHDHGRSPTRRPVSAPPTPRAKESQRGYTIAHAGRQIRFGPVVFWIAVGTVSLLGIWSAATATYFAFRDDVLTRLIARQADMQYAYEDRISELRARVDRTTSRQLLDQEQFDKKLGDIMRRQALLESRAAALSALPDAPPSVLGMINLRGRVVPVVDVRARLAGRGEGAALPHYQHLVIVQAGARAVDALSVALSTDVGVLAEPGVVSTSFEVTVVAAPDPDGSPAPSPGPASGVGDGDLATTGVTMPVALALGAAALMIAAGAALMASSRRRRT